MQKPHYFKHVVMVAKGWYGHYDPQGQLDTVEKIMCKVCALTKIPKSDIANIITDAFTYALIKTDKGQQYNPLQRVVKDTFFGFFSNHLKEIPPEVMLLNYMLCEMSQVEVALFDPEDFILYAELSKELNGGNHDEMLQRAVKVGIKISYDKIG